MPPCKLIKVNNGVTTQVYETRATTIGELFTPEFREDHNISQTGKPTINGVVVDPDTRLEHDCTVGYINTASQKS
jgi:hypothetical protein